MLQKLETLHKSQKDKNHEFEKRCHKSMREKYSFSIDYDPIEMHKTIPT